MIIKDERTQSIIRNFEDLDEGDVFLVVKESGLANFYIKTIDFKYNQFGDKLEGNCFDKDMHPAHVEEREPIIEMVNSMLVIRD